MKKFGLAVMTTLSLASASCLALTSSSDAADMVLKAAAVEAAQPVSGYVELYSGWGNNKSNDFFEFGNSSFDGWNLGGAGRATYWWSRGASIQLDVQGDGTSYSGFRRDGRVSEHSFLIGGHMSWRDPRYLWGVFGAVGDATGQDIFGIPSYRHGIVGAEGQAYLGAFTLYGQIGYDTTIGNSLFGIVDSINAWYLRGTVRYYLTANTRLEGTGLYAWGTENFNGRFGPDQDFNIWMVRAKLEHKFSGSPFSAFVAYEFSRHEFDNNNNFNNGKAENTKLTAGIRLGINEGTLQANDSRGTTLDIIDVGKMFRLGFGDPRS
jgi:hypothetical protein